MLTLMLKLKEMKIIWWPSLLIFRINIAKIVVLVLLVKKLDISVLVLAWTISTRILMPITHSPLKSIPITITLENLSDPLLLIFYPSDLEVSEDVIIPTRKIFIITLLILPLVSCKLVLKVKSRDLTLILPCSKMIIINVSSSSILNPMMTMTMLLITGPRLSMKHWIMSRLTNLCEILKLNSCIYWFNSFSWFKKLMLYSYFAY